VTVRLRHDGGQVAVLTAVFMLAALGMAGLVLDVGSWFRAQRLSQTTVDAAALAGAQALPENSDGATAAATDFAGRNGGIAGVQVSVGSKWSPNDLISVKQSGPAPGFFSNLFGISTVTVSASATAVVAPPTATRFVAPIAVNIKHRDLSGPGCPCFDDPTTLPLGKTGAPGAFTLVDLIPGDTNGTVGSSTLADWIARGYDDYLPLGGYFSDPGAKFNNSQIQAALQNRYGTDLLFPVYDTLVGEGSNATYHIVAWAGFHLTLAQASGTDGVITGYFTRFIAQGLVPLKGPTPGVPDFGVRSIALID
jgi:hypothetical protein